MKEPYIFDTSKIAEAISKSMGIVNMPDDIIPDDIINEQIYDLDNYLPVLYNNESEREYIQTLFKALEISYSNELYQFAYIQLHMIFMVCIYYILLQINEIAPHDMKTAIYYMIKDKTRFKDFFGDTNTRHGKLYFGSFAVLGESDVFHLLKIIGIDADLHGELESLVRERNKYAHANGNITITSQETIDSRISKYMNTLNRVYNLIKNDIIKLYVDTLANPEFYDSEIRQYYEESTQIEEELIRKYFLSPKQLNLCRKIDISEFSAHDGFENIKSMHIALCNYYRDLADGDSD